MKFFIRIPLRLWANFSFLNFTFILFTLSFDYHAQVLLKETAFSWGGTWDIPFCIVKDKKSDSFIVSGYFETHEINAKAALMKFSQNFDTLWSVKNPEDSTVSNHYSLAYQEADNSLFWFSRRRYGVEISEITKVDAETGNVLFRIKKTNPGMTLGVWGEKILVAEAETWENYEFKPSFLNILNLDGSVFSSFVWDTYGSGNMTLETMGDYLWISGYSGSTAVIKKFHLPEGTLIWERSLDRQNFIGFPMGCLDAYGNFYLAYNEVHGYDPLDIFYREFGVEKYSPEGDLLWQTKWTPLPVAEKVNYTNVFAGVACSEEKNIVIPFGAMDKNSESWYWGYESAYMAGLNMQTGEIVWDKRWNWDQMYDPAASMIRDALFDNGDFIVLGNAFFRSDGQIPNICFMQRWAIDKIVGVEEKSPSPPYSFLLFQNYPNPFNPSTTISFTIPNSEFVSLKVYDVLGKEVATLVNEEKLAGTYDVQFDATGFSSGVYFYRLVSGENTMTKKMVLLR